MQEVTLSYILNIPSQKEIQECPSPPDNSEEEDSHFVEMESVE